MTPGSEFAMNYLSYNMGHRPFALFVLVSFVLLGCGTGAENKEASSPSRDASVPKDVSAKTLPAKTESLNSQAPPKDRPAKPAQAEEKPVPFQEGKKWGFKHRRKVIAPAHFEEVHYFRQGFAAVQLGKRWGYIDTKGKYLVEPLYEEAGSFGGGFARVQKGGKWGLINLSGKLVIPTKFERIIYNIAKDLFMVKEGKEWGVISSVTGRYIVEPKYEAFAAGPHGLFAVKLGSKWGFIDQSAKMVIQPKFDDIDRNKENGEFAIILGRKRGYLDKDRKLTFDNHNYFVRKEAQKAQVARIDLEPLSNEFSIKELNIQSYFRFFFVSPDGKLALAWEKGLEVWDLKSQKMVKRDVNFSHWPVALSRDGKTVAAFKKDGSIQLLNFPELTVRRTLTKRKKPLHHEFRFLPDGQTLAVAKSNEIFLWDMQTGQLRHSFAVYGSLFDFLSDGKRLVTRADGRLLLWDAETAKLHSSVKVGWIPSPDGKYTAKGSSVRAQAHRRPRSPGPLSVTLWDAHTEKQLAKWGHMGYDISVAFSPDSKILAAGGLNTVKLWDVKTHKLLAEFAASPNNLDPKWPRWPSDWGRSDFSVEFSSDGKYLITLCQGARVWNVAELLRDKK